MKVYQLTREEQLVIERTSTKNVILVVCDLGNLGCVVDYDALNKSIYAKYSTLLGSVVPDRIIEITQIDPEFQLSRRGYARL